MKVNVFNNFEQFCAVGVAEPTQTQGDYFWAM